MKVVLKYQRSCQSKEWSISCPYSLQFECFPIICYILCRILERKALIKLKHTNLKGINVKGTKWLSKNLDFFVSCFNSFQCSFGLDLIKIFKGFQSRLWCQKDAWKTFLSTSKLWGIHWDTLRYLVPYAKELPLV